ncbi:MAG: hypothetical protein H8E42_14015 [Nitrospinae bacterium]|nr:hypothetical protein [Nitrospinota bacterium]MBL7018939.1 hypothetical protein [Nitrospinaceae bacterium]
MIGPLIPNDTPKSPTPAIPTNASTNVIYADKDLNIQYMNPACEKTLKTLEQYLPVKVDEILGKSIDIFHQNPAHQRKILADHRNLPHQVITQLGPKKIYILVSVIYDNKQDYLGLRLSWSVVTEK